MTTVLERSFPITDYEYRDEGRTLVGLIVPYDSPTVVTTRDGTYPESFVMGAFRTDIIGAERVGNAHWVKLTLEHDQSLGNRLGYGSALEESREGLIGTFSLYASEAAKAQEVIGETHKGLSVGFLPLSGGAKLSDDGETVVRTRCRLDHVAVTPVPAYEGARVLALREEQAGVELERPRLEQVQEYLDSLGASR